MADSDNRGDAHRGVYHKEDSPKVARPARTSARYRPRIRCLARNKQTTLKVLALFGQQRNPALRAFVVPLPKKEFIMTISPIVHLGVVASVGVLASAILASSGSRPAPPAHASGNPHCTHVGGSIITNFGAVDPNTTLGPATGDLRGAVAATLLTSPQPGPIVNGVQSVIFNVQHHWVTEAGDNIYFDQAVATTAPLSQTRFAVITYPANIVGGTGKFAGATGHLDFVGEADLQSGTALRYSGQVCDSE